MNKIIDGHRYNTDTARKSATDSYGNVGDFYYWSETLYKTKSGYYFLHGEGGSNSRYAESVSDNTWSGGEKIIPLSESAAKEWAEEHVDGDTYERIFGVVDEDSDKVQISASISADTKDKMDRLKKLSGETTAELIDRLIQERYKLI